MAAETTLLGLSREMRTRRRRPSLPQGGRPHREQSCECEREPRSHDCHSSPAPGLSGRGYCRDWLEPDHPRPETHGVYTAAESPARGHAEPHARSPTLVLCCGGWASSPSRPCVTHTAPSLVLNRPMNLPCSRVPE